MFWTPIDSEVQQHVISIEVIIKCQTKRPRGSIYNKAKNTLLYFHNIINLITNGPR